jgi:hypothetical protein
MFTEPLTRNGHGIRQPHGRRIVAALHATILARKMDVKERFFECLEFIYIAQDG